MFSLQIEFKLLVILALIYLSLGLPAIDHKNDLHERNNLIDVKEQNKKFYGRIKRQLDLDLGVDHEEDIGTDITAALNANLWKSDDGNSRLDLTSRYSQHFDEFGHNGKSKVGGNIHFIHNY